MPTNKIRNNTKKGNEKSNHQTVPSKKQQQGNLTQFKEERSPQATSTIPTMGEGNKMTMGAVGSRKRKPARESLQYVQHGGNEAEKTMDTMATFLEQNQQQMVSNIID